MSKILIADDKDDNLVAYKLAISDSQLNIEIFTAKNEYEANEKIANEDFDIILTDLVMIESDGGMKVLELAKKKNPFSMVIVITAFDDILQRYHAYELGAFDCITKGTPGIKTADEIIVKIKAALSYRELALKEINNQRNLNFLKRYFDPNIYKVILNNPGLLEPINKTVTIVFWDIRGFSKLCEILKANPNLISGFLQEYFQKASEIIFKYQGVLDKFIGDGIMAIFGSIDERDKDGKRYAKAAIDTAIELREEFKKLHKNWVERWSLYTANVIDIGLGCGIHTGEAIVGNLGTKERDHYTAIGPNVNFAQRIESKALKDQILVSTTTKKRVENDFDFILVDTFKDVKNIPGEFEIFELKK